MTYHLIQVRLALSSLSVDAAKTLVQGQAARDSFDELLCTTLSYSSWPIATCRTPNWSRPVYLSEIGASESNTTNKCLCSHFLPFWLQRLAPSASRTKSSSTVSANLRSIRWLVHDIMVSKFRVSPQSQAWDRRGTEPLTTSRMSCSHTYIHIHTYTYMKFITRCIVENGSNQKRGLLLGGGV